MVRTLSRASAFVLLALSSQPCGALRLGDDVQAPPAKESAPKEEKKKEGGPCAGRRSDKELKAWFAEHKSELGSQAGTDEFPSGDGTHDNPAWGYLKTDCMKQRYKKTLKEVHEHSCETVVEVGGYLTPLANFFPGGSDADGKGEGGAVKSYINIDPSMPDAKMVEAEGMCQVNLPMTLADFFDKKFEEVRKKFHLKFERATNCAVMMGLWDPQLKTHTDRKAIATLSKESKWAGIESPSDELNNFDTGTKLINGVGLNTYKNDTVNCFGTLENLRKSTAVREMRFFHLEQGKTEEKKEEKKEDNAKAPESLAQATPAVAGGSDGNMQAAPAAVAAVPQAPSSANPNLQAAPAAPSEATSGSQVPA